MVFEKAIERAPAAEEEEQRVKNLMDTITYSIYIYTTRGLFERDKLIFSTQMTFQVISWDDQLVAEDGVSNFDSRSPVQEMSSIKAAGCRFFERRTIKCAVQSTEL